MRWLVLRPGWGFGGIGARLPRATLRGCAASLCPRLDCPGPFGANSCMLPCCSAAHGHKVDTLLRNILKLPWFRRSPRLPSFHHPSLALSTRVTSFLNTMTGHFHDDAGPQILHHSFLCPRIAHGDSAQRSLSKDAVTVVVMPPRGVNSAMIFMRLGSSTATRSSRIRLVTFS